jgi:hypothetical protein
MRKVWKGTVGKRTMYLTPSPNTTESTQLNVATPVRDRMDFVDAGKHGGYAWADEVFNVEHFTLDRDEVMRTYNVSKTVTIPSNVRKHTYRKGACFF